MFYRLNYFIFVFSLGVVGSVFYPQLSLGGESFVKNEVLLTIDEKVQKLATESLKGGSLLPIKDELQGIIKENPTSANAYYWLGRVYLEADDLTSVIQFYRASVKNNPYRSSVRVELAKMLTDDGLLEEALSELNKILSAEPVNLVARDARANVYAEQGKLNSAIQEYVSLVRLAPNHPLAQVAKTKLETLYFRVSEDIALNLDQEDKKAQAIKMSNVWILQELLDPAQWLLTKVLKISPDDLEVNYLLGVLYGRRGQMQLAIKYLSYVVDEDPNNTSYLRAYAKVLARAGYLGLAEDNYLEIIRIEKKDGIESDALNEMSLVRGEKLIRRGSFQAAINYYEGLLLKDSNNPVLLTRIANIYMSLGEAKSANKYNQRKVGLDRKKNETLYYQRQGRNFFLAGKAAEAKFTYEKLIELNPKNSQAYYWISKIYEQEGQFDTAIAYMKKSVKYAGTNLSLKKEYARLLIRAKKMKQASAYYLSMAESSTSAKEKNDFKRMSKFILGQDLLQRDKMQEALSHYQAMALQFRNDIPVLEALAGVYVQLNFYSEAEETFLFTLDIDKERASTHLMLAGLYYLMGDQDKRLANYARVFELDPLGASGKQALNVLLMSAQTNFNLGNFGMANVEYRAALAFDPNNVVAASSAAIIGQKMQQGKYSEIMYSRVLQNDPNNMKVRVQFGHMFVSAGQFDRAISEFEAIVILRPASMEGREAVANLNIIYNARADDVIARLNGIDALDEEIKAKLIRSLDEEIVIAVELAREWIEKKKQITPAQKLLKAVLDLRPDDGQAHYWLGSIYDQYRLFDLALIHIGISVSVSPDNLQLLSAFGRLLARAGNLDAAQAVYTNVIDQARGTPLAKATRALRGYVVGLRLMNQKRYADALAHYRAMEVFQPDDTPLQMRIANVFLNMGQLEDAEIIFSTILKREPENPSVYLKLAEIYNKAGDEAKFYRALKMAIFLDSDGIVERSALNKMGFAKGLFKLKEKRWDEAIGFFNYILDKSPGNLQAMLGIASAYLGKSEYGKAETLFLEILKEDPSNIDARLKMAQLYIITKRIQQAVAELEKVVAVSVETREGREALLNLTNIYRQRGAAFLVKGMGDAAVVEYRKAVSHDEDDWKSHHALADIFKSGSTTVGRMQAQKYIDTAIKHYKEAVRIKPDLTEAYMSLGALYEGRQKFSLAMEAFVSALAYIGADKDEMIAVLSNGVRMQVVRQEYGLQNMLWVIDELVSMAEVEPESSRILLFLSSVYIWADDIDNAIVTLKKVVKLTPENVNAQYRLGQLYEQDSELLRAAAIYRDIIFSSQTDRIVGAARQRLISVEERLQFLTMRLRYSNLLTESDFALVPVNISSSSSLNLNMIARLRPEKGIELSFSANPSYSAFRDSESDSLVSNYAFNANFNERKGYIILNVSQSETQGLLTEEVRGKDRSASITQGLRLRIPSFLSSPGAVMRSTLQGNLSYREFIGDDITKYDVRTVSLSGLYSQPFRTGGSISLTAQQSDVGNLRPLGADYASVSQTVSVRINRPLASRMSGYVNGSLTYSLYKNIDTLQYSIFGIREKRRSGQIGLGMGLRYQMHRKLSFFLDASYSMNNTSINKTSVPLGYIYTTAGIPVGIKSSSLADYSTTRVSSGIQFQF